MNTTQSDKTDKTLMIVEDEALVAIVLRDELKDAGYHVLDLTDRNAQAVGSHFGVRIQSAQNQCFTLSHFS